MAFEAAKCPSCGASIQVPSDAEQARCMYCENILTVRDAIQKLKIEVSGIVKLPGLSSVENDIARGNQCLEAQDWQRAYRIFCTAIDKQADCYDALMGCLVAITRTFHTLIFSGFLMKV